MRFRKAGTAAAALAAIGSAVLYGAGPASADVVGTKYVSTNCIDSTCDGGLYVNYHSVATSGSGNPSGSFADFYGNLYSHDYIDSPTTGTNAFIRYYFIFDKSMGDGGGLSVKNNAASADNCSTVDGYRIYYNTGYAGHSQFISHVYGCSGSWNLDSTLKNNNASSHYA
ncbi:hypothetical protein [Streptomyces sp. LaBMicrA B280]|uniref:hypothetical protein n=1 Tax=Streptomyces sp. LaBMicrA B280 TaxID=3391001 RepID=UPI003BA66DB5